MKTEVPQKPKTHLGIPNWCHMHGSKMKIKEPHVSNSLLIITGSAASVKITRYGTIADKKWSVDWEVIQSRYDNEKSSGRVIFSSDVLRAAFGLTNDSGDCGRWLINRYGADSAEQGKFIRWRNFLNIPCPGTGYDGDPNVSIHLDDEIKDAVRQLLQ